MVAEISRRLLREMRLEFAFGVEETLLIRD